MSAIAAALSLVTALGQPGETRGTFAAADRTETRIRDFAPPENPAFDVENTPAGRLVLEVPEARLAAEYAPRLTLRNLNISTTYELVHNGQVEAVQRGQTATTTLLERGSVGRNNFSSLALTTNPDGTPRVEAVPPGAGPRELQYGSTETTLTIVATSLRRWLFTSHLAYLLAGGLDDDSRVIVPVQSAASAGFEASHAIDRRGHASVSLDASRTSLSTGPRYLSIAPGVGIDRLLTPHLLGKIVVGAAAVFGDDEAEAVSGTTSSMYPTGEATLTLRSVPTGDAERHADPLGSRLLFASVRWGPQFNRVTGAFIPGIEGRLSGSWTRGPWSASISGGARESIPPTRLGGSQVLLAETTVSWRPIPALELSLGGRLAYQSIEPTVETATPTSATVLAQKLAFIAIDVRSTPMIF